MVHYSTPLGKLRTFALYCQFGWFWYNRVIRKQTGVDAGAARWLTIVLQQPHGELLYYIASLSVL